MSPSKNLPVQPVPEQVITPSQHDVRKELHEVRKELNDKIDEKLAERIFCWAMGILITVLMVCLGVINNKVDNIQQRLTILETKFDFHPSH